MKPLIKSRTPQSNAKPSEPTDSEQYRQLIKLDRYALDVAAEEQAQHFLSICDKHTQAVSLRDEAKEILAQTDAELASEIRQQKDQGRMTEGAIYDQVIQDKRHQIAAQNYESKRRDADYWNNLRAAFDQRAKMIHELTSQYAAGYFTVQSTVGSKQISADKGRAALHNARNQS